MDKKFLSRKEEGNKYEEIVFSKLQCVNELKHSSDHTIWINGMPIWVETKRRFAIEVKSYDEQMMIASKGHRVLLVCDVVNAPKACWIEDVKIKKTFDDYFLSGVYSINAGHFEDALKVLAKAAEMEPKEGKVPYMMSLAAIKDGDEDGGLKHLEKAVKIDDFFKILAQNETDFENLSKNETFQNIVGME